MTRTVYDHIRPRPIHRLPEPASSAIRKRTAEALARTYSLSEPAATAISEAFVDHGAVRGHIATPERRRVPGGELLVVRADAWTRRLGPDPANLRTGPGRVHAFAVTPGSGGENSRFAPVAAPVSDPAGRPELCVRVENRPHLEWAHARAAEYVLRTNDWRTSIASQGVMEELWVAAVAYHHDDGSPDLAVCQTAEGSSRLTACRAHLGGDVVADLYGLKDISLRAQVKRLNSSFDHGTLALDEEALMRSFIVPAMFVVGFDPVDSVDPPPFHVAVSSLVALRHVDPPQPWGEASEMEALADAVLDELERRRIIKPDQRRWLAGAMTKEEAAASHFSPDPAVRSAHITWLFCSSEDRIQLAIRAAVTAQSTRRQIRQKLKDHMATALILRSLDHGARQREQIRKYLNEGTATEWHRRPWTATQRPVSELEAAALAEVNGLARPTDEPGPATVELAARAMYPLITKLQLHADRGTANNRQPDRRTPGSVLETMRRSRHGVRQLAQAARDVGRNHVRSVDPAGRLVTGSSGQPVDVADPLLRQTFPDSVKANRPDGPADTPEKKLAHAVADLDLAIAGVTDKMQAVLDVKGSRGSVVKEFGISPALAYGWVRTLADVRDNAQLWGFLGQQQVVTGEDDEIDDLGSRDADYDALDDEELVELARARGLDVGVAKDRDDLIDLLVESDESDAIDDEDPGAAPGEVPLAS